MVGISSAQLCRQLNWVPRRTVRFGLCSDTVRGDIPCVDFPELESESELEWEWDWDWEWNWNWKWSWDWNWNWNGRKRKRLCKGKVTN